jgi:hypothetical protein
LIHIGDGRQHFRHDEPRRCARFGHEHLLSTRAHLLIRRAYQRPSTTAEQPADAGRIAEPGETLQQVEAGLDLEGDPSHPNAPFALNDDLGNDPVGVQNVPGCGGIGQLVGNRLILDK